LKPITYNLSSEKTGFKVCLSNANLQRYIAVFESHGDQVLALPPGAEALASSDTVGAVHVVEFS
jgi:GMP synthase-like glutamine amidotransferase